MRGATDALRRFGERGVISILAPLAGRDGVDLVAEDGGERISILAPLAGRDSKNAQKSRVFLQ